MSYDSMNFKIGIAAALCSKVGTFLQGEPVEPDTPVEPPILGDYSGTSTNLLGYAWCLGRAVPVYNKPGLVDNPQYARFYIDELPTFSFEDYPYATVSFNARLLDLTKADYLEIMQKGAFETVGDFPFMSMLHRTDVPVYTPYGIQMFNDERKYAIGAYLNSLGTALMSGRCKYFDFYLTGSYGVEGLYQEEMSCAIRSDQRAASGKSFLHSDGYQGTIFAGDTNSVQLTTKNVAKYLVMTQTPTRL